MGGKKMEAATLNDKLSNGGESLLIVDTRPFLKYNLSHICGAQNIHCPPIVKRRSEGKLPLENVVRCPRIRKELLSADCVYAKIIVYDDSTTNLQNLPKDSNMALALKSLTDQLNIEVTYLSGGFCEFSRLYPGLTEGYESSSSMDSSCVPSTTSSPRSPASMAAIVDTIRCNPGQDQGDPVEILPYLFLGNVFHAGQEERLTQLGVTALLNVSTEEDPPASCLLHCKRLRVDDNCMSDIGCWFPEAIQFIENCRESGGKVLVHCKAGISRSATICLAYLMWLNKWTLEQAYDYLKAKRRLISPNLNFMRQLLEFEQQLTTSRTWIDFKEAGRGGGVNGCGGGARIISSAPPVAPSTSCAGGLGGGGARPPRTLPLTPCSSQVFSFDLPGTPSPPQMMCGASPLVSPS